MKDEVWVSGSPLFCRVGRLAIGFFCGLALLCCAAGVHAQEPADGQPGDAEQEAAPASPAPGLAVSFGGSATIASAFVWRGFVLGADPAVQPSVWAKIGPVTVTSWSNMYVPSARKARYSEHDLSVDYSRDVHGATLSFGWTNYAYPHEATGRYSNEFYVAVGGGGYLSPKVQVYQDVNGGNGTYAMLAVSHEYAAGSSKASLTPTISLGYNHHQWTDRTGFSDVTASATLALPTPVPHLVLQPFLGYSYGLQTAVFPRQLYGGVTIAVQ